MSAPSQRALLLEHRVAEFKGRVNALLDYAEIHPQATFAELEAQARQLGRDCFATVMEGLLGWRSQELEGFSPGASVVRRSGTKVSNSGARDLRGQDHLATGLLLLL